MASPHDSYTYGGPDGDDTSSLGPPRSYMAMDHGMPYDDPYSDPSSLYRPRSIRSSHSSASGMWSARDRPFRYDPYDHPSNRHYGGLPPPPPPPAPVRSDPYGYHGDPYPYYAPPPPGRPVPREYDDGYYMERPPYAMYGGRPVAHEPGRYYPPSQPRFDRSKAEDLYRPIPSRQEYLQV